MAWKVFLYASLVILCFILGCMHASRTKFETKCAVFYAVQIVSRAVVIGLGGGNL